MKPAVEKLVKGEKVNPVDVGNLRLTYGDLVDVILALHERLRNVEAVVSHTKGFVPPSSAA